MTYERLTDKNNLYWAIQETPLTAEIGIYLTDCLNRLAELEDKIERGTLIELPCKVGQDIYYITDKRKIVHRIAREYRYLVDLGWEITATLWETKRTGELCLRTSIIHSEEIGKTAFFTREEAEKRLKELQE